MNRVARILSDTTNNYSLVVRKDKKTGYNILSDEVGVLDRYSNVLSILKEVKNTDNKYYKIKVNILDILNTADVLGGLNDVVFLFLNSKNETFDAYCIKLKDIFELNITLLDKDGNAIIKFLKGDSM